MDQLLAKPGSVEFLRHPPPTLVGMPAVYPVDESGVTMGGRTNNCWVSASIALLANDPLIAIFVRDVWNPHATWIYTDKSRMDHENNQVLVRSIIRPEYSHQIERESNPGSTEIKCTLAIIHCIGLMSQPETSDELTRASAALYGLKIKLVTPTDPVVQEEHMGDALRDGFESDLRLMCKAMCKWWKPNTEIAKTFRRYGYHLHRFNAKRCTVCQRATGSTTLDAPNLRETPIDVTATGITIEPAAESSGRPLILQQHINDVIFNGIENIAGVRHTQSNWHDKSKHDSKDHTSDVRSTTLIQVLPWRLAISVMRHTGRNGAVSTPDLLGSIVYNPRSLVIGPTQQTGEYANYRLVGRMHWANKHWTAVVLPLGSRDYNTSYIESTRYPEAPDKSWPSSLTTFNLDAVTRLEEPLEFDQRTCQWIDKTATVLIFERYDAP